MPALPRALLVVTGLSLWLNAQVIVPDFVVNDPVQNTAWVGRTAIAVAANGAFAVAWQDSNYYNYPIPAMPRVAVQLFDGNAIPVGPLNLFNGETRSGITYLDDYLTGAIDLEFLPSGYLLVAVQHEGLFDNLVTQVWSWEAGIGAVSPTGQIVDLLAGTGVINWIYAYDLVDTGNLRLDVMPGGGFWGTLNGPSYNTDFSAVLIQQFDANVNYVGNYFTPHTGDPGPNANHVFPDIASDGTILFSVWQDGRQDANYDISGQFYTAGAPLGGNIRINSGDPAGTINAWPSLAMNAAGNSVVVWADGRTGSGEIFGQRFNGSGQPVGGNFQVSAGTGAILDRPEVAMRTDGSFMVVWTDSMDNATGIAALRARGRQYDSAGNPTGPPFIVPDRNLPSALVSIASNGNHYFLSWLDTRYDNVTANVYAKVVGDAIIAIEPAFRPDLGFLLEPNYPNPFNPSTSIAFILPEAGEVRLEVFSVTGQRVDVVTAGYLPAGRHAVTWSATRQPSGIYFCRLTAAGPSGTVTATRRMVMVK